MSNIVKQEYWNKQYKNIVFSEIDKEYYLRSYIEKYIPTNLEGIALEIGCFPGRYLSIFGNLGYELNGIDLNPETRQLPSIIKEHGFKVGNIIEADFLEWDHILKYDVVSSFGFVEHFTNIDVIILKHAELVATNGYLVIETPNFNGWIQYFFHYLFDTPNLRRHIRKNMNPFYWKDIIMTSNLNFNILCCEYCGGIDFWTDMDQPKIQNFFAKIMKRLWYGIQYVLPFVKFSRINCKAASRSCILIAKKIN